MHVPRYLRWSVLALLVGAASMPSPASACGGTFCDNGPNAMPVDQTGENILFVLDGQNVEAHVQIQYQGAAERFAWVVPMPKVPEVSVGSQPLFTSLLRGTVPTYGFTTQFDTCGRTQDAGFQGTGGSGGSGGFAGGAGSGGSGGPNVVFKKTVGAFDVTVLSGGTAQEVSDWLTTNGYQGIPSAPAILGDYVAKNYVFAAIKLTGGADVDEIHPLVFRYPGNEPCVPLKLTAVAAKDDMAVRAFFLGDDRAYPAGPNYMHVTLNPVRLDWSNRATNYVQVVSRAVDSAVANGRAFITEYAGVSSVVGIAGVYSTSWNEIPFASIAPEQVVTQLQSQGLASCFSSVCQWNHPLLLGLLQQYLPVPTGLTEPEFYANLLTYSSRIDRTKWDAAKFTLDFKARIVEPGKHARDILARYPYLTRLLTTISPTEMTLDPEFVMRPDLSSSVAPASTAVQRVTCQNRRGMVLPDNRQVALDGTSWPAFSSRMPWVEKVEEVRASGAPIELVDNTEAIDKELSLWNASQNWPPSGSGAAGGAGGSTGGSAAGGFPIDNPPFGSASDAAGPSGGCSCGIVDGDAGASLAALGIAGLFLARLRRKMRS